MQTTKTQTTLPSVYQSIIHLSRYSRYVPDEKRRETWENTVDRYINYLYKKIKYNSNVSEETKKHLYSVLGATCEP